MFTTTAPEFPAWLLSALALIAGVGLLVDHVVVPGVVAALALAGIVAAVALTDSSTKSIFPWVIVVLAVIGIIILAALSDAIPQWLEAVAGVGVVGGSSLALPAVIAPKASTTPTVATVLPIVTVGPPATAPASVAAAPPAPAPVAAVAIVPPTTPTDQPPTTPVA
jgi:hypothetical protein